MTLTLILLSFFLTIGEDPVSANMYGFPVR